MQPPGQGGEVDGGTWAIVIALAAMLLNVVTSICTGVWTLGRTRNATDDRIAEKEKVVSEEIVKLERRLEERIDTAGRQFGETVGAIRAKVTEVELWNRDTFVSKETFQTTTDELKRWLERFEDHLDARLNQIDQKLDRRPLDKRIDGL